MPSKKIKNCWELKLERTQWKQTFHGKKIENKQYPKDYHLQKKKPLFYNEIIILFFFYIFCSKFLPISFPLIASYWPFQTYDLVSWS